MSQFADERRPHDARSLVERLDGMFPPRCIRPGESLEEAHRYAGMRALVDLLAATYGVGRESQVAPLGIGEFGPDPDDDGMED